MAGVTPLWKMCREHMHLKNEYARGFLGEFLGTAILCMFAVGAGIQAFMQNHVPGAAPVSSIQPVLGGVFGLMLAIVVTGGISGAHINPAVSLGFAIVGELSWLKLPVYWVAQLFGGYVGSGLAVSIYKGYGDVVIKGLEQQGAVDVKYRDILNPNVFSSVPMPCSTTADPPYKCGESGVCMGNGPIPIGTGFLDQILTTSLLLLGALAVIDKRNMKIPKHLVGISFALIVAAITMCFGFNFGAAMNPARDLCPRLMALTLGFKADDIMNSLNLSGDCQPWWLVGIFGPLIGAALGSFVYVLVIGAHLDDDEEQVAGSGRPDSGNPQDWRSTHFIPKAQAPNPPPPPPPQGPNNPYGQGGQGGGPGYSGGQGGVNNNGFMRDDMRYRQGY